MRERSSGFKCLDFWFLAAVVVAVLGFLPPAAMATGLRVILITFKSMIAVIDVSWTCGKTVSLR